MCTEDKRECIGSTHGNFLNYGEPDDCVTRQAMSDRQQDVCWLQVRAWHWRPGLHSRDPPALAHGLTVKLSPFQCNHSSSARRIAACLCGH